MKKILLLLASGTAMLLMGCAAVPGAKEGEVAPKISKYGDELRWDNVGSFGPVPPALAMTAAADCATLNKADTKYVATGYHSKALDLNGKPFPGGGYFCTKQ
ncbi:hypothetical protein [Variovorax ginsengisoli]|uniref:Lipoprotein n=1 Tax=Variovorax ginsengisoli TaxID=363844 RepID=A0ABT9SB84_9BURK|nr:hypothetical protein [Variovorax ginsengisoli]MDP9901021.1 hypothetical protein [Variovorax ginsengisoli]